LGGNTAAAVGGPYWLETCAGAEAAPAAKPASRQTKSERRERTMAKNLIKVEPDPARGLSLRTSNGLTTRRHSLCCYMHLATVKRTRSSRLRIAGGAKGRMTRVICRTSDGLMK
jgi:hypothetical protein